MGRIARREYCLIVHRVNKHKDMSDGTKDEHGIPVVNSVSIRSPLTSCSVSIWTALRDKRQSSSNSTKLDEAVPV